MSKGKPKRTASREEQLSAMGLDASADEMSELRKRAVDLEAELDRWKNQPWQLDHDYPGGGSAGGRRRGESAVSEALNDLQLKAMLDYIGENTTGPAVVGSVLLLIEYLGALAFTKRFNDLDMAIDGIRRGLLNGDYMEEYNAESLRLYTIERADDWITFRVTSDIQRLAEDYQKHTDERSRAKREGSADA